MRPGLGQGAAFRRVVQSAEKRVGEGDGVHVGRVGVFGDGGIDLRPLLQHDDQLRQRALATVQQWLRKDPQSRSASLWHEWVETLQGRSYRKVLGRSVHAQQLRQASPLPTIIPSDVRQRLLDEARLLKNGLILDGQAKAGKS